MTHINFNGKIMAAGAAVIDPDNRGFRYGDGLFETIKYRHNEFQFLAAHLDRLWEGLLHMHFQVPKLFTREYLQQELIKLVQKNKHTHARVRLQVFRGAGGLYDAINHQPHFVIQSWPLSEDFGKLNSNGIQLCIYPDAYKSCDKFSNLKHSNFLPYVMGALFAKQQQCNDALILNEHNNVCDSTIANIFIIKDGIIKTPSLEQGCIAGVMRRFMIDQLGHLGFEVEQTIVRREEVLQADEIFLTSSMVPMKWVAGVGNTDFGSQQIVAIHAKLQQTFPSVFC